MIDLHAANKMVSETVAEMITGIEDKNENGMKTEMSTEMSTGMTTLTKQTIEHENEGEVENGAGSVTENSRRSEVDTEAMG